MRLLRKLSIRSQLLILAGSIIVVILFIIFYTYSMMAKMITQNHEGYVKQTVSEIKQTVAGNADVIARLMQNISFNEDVQNYLVESNDLNRFILSQRLDKLLNNQKDIKNGISDIVISGRNGTWIDIYGGNKFLAALKDSIPAKVNAYYVGMRSFGNVYGSEYSLIFATKIYYAQQNELFNTDIGTLFFIVDPKALVVEPEHDSGTNTQIYLLERSDKVFASNVGADVGALLPESARETMLADNSTIDWNGTSYLVQRETLPAIDGSIVSMAPKDELLRDVSKIRKAELTMLVAGLLILAVPFVFVVNNILLPLKKLILFMTKVKRGDLEKLKKRISLQGYTEIGVMAAEFNSMLDEIDILTHRLLETNTRLYGIELEKKKSELAYLRSQINPHFLYNTLEAITGIAVVEGQSKIKTMTRALSQIFRYSIKGSANVPLKEEIRMIESYVQIQQIRFANRFQVHYEFTDAALDFIVPKMILQPVVENAIYHGFEPTLRMGSLRMEASVDDRGDLVVLVEDNGVGIDADRLGEIRLALAESLPEAMERSEQRSIGLANINNRLKLTFGPHCGVQIDSKPGEGTRIRLTIAPSGRERIA